MPKGPQGQHRPGDAIGTAVQVARIAIGEIEDEVPGKNIKKQIAGKISGSKGGKQRATNLTSEHLSAIGKKGALARWGSS